jgi:lipopolysaccharide export system protein LptA
MSMAFKRPSIASLAAWALAAWALAAVPATAQETTGSSDVDVEPSPSAATGDNDFGFDDSGKPIEISAENGIEWRKDERIYIARGNALAVQGESSVKGDVLTAYFGVDDKIARWVAEGNVEVKTDTSTSYGDVADYDAKTRVMVMTGKNLKTVTEDETVTARDQLEYWRNEDVVVAEGNVVIVQDETTIHADKAIGYFRREADGKKKMHQMDATGKVRIDKEEQTAFSDKLAYQPDTEIAILTGNVIIYDDGNRYEGGKAELDMKRDISRILADGTSDGRVHTVIKPKEETTPVAAPAVSQ